MAISRGQQQVAGQGASRARLVRGGLWAAARMAALVVAGVALVLLVAGVVPRAVAGPASSLRENLGSVLSVVALVVLIVAAVRLARAGSVSVNGWVYGPPSSRDQRAQALAAVRGNQAVAEPEVALTVAVAVAAAREGRGAPAWVAIALLATVQALGMATWWLAVVMVAVAAVVVLAVITACDARRARRWLATHHRQPTSA